MELEIYNLQPKQQEFADSEAKFRLFGGAKGGGKSYAFRAEAVNQSMSRKGVRGLILRRTLSEIRENTILPIETEMPQGTYKHNENHKELTFFPTGSVLHYSYCKNLKDVKQFQGVEYDFIGIEELTHWTYTEWFTLMGSLRSTKKGVRPNFFASANPGGIGHKWVRRVFVHKKFEENEKGIFTPDQFDFIPARVWDNKILLENDPTYLATLNAMPEHLRRALRDGDWNVFEGQFFPEFREDLHVIAPFKIIARRRIVALDYGFKNPSCVLWMAEDMEGKVYVYRELYVTNKTYAQLATMIKAMTPADERIDGYYGDPAFVQKRNEGTGTTAYQEFRAKGIVLRGAVNDRLAGWTLIRECLQPYRDMQTGRIETTVKITRNCSNLIRTLPDMIHDSVKVEDMDTSGEDHAPDTFRYGLMALKPQRQDLNAYVSVGTATTEPLFQKVQGTNKRSFDNVFKKPEDRDEKGSGFFGQQF